MHHDSPAGAGQSQPVNDLFSLVADLDRADAKNAEGFRMLTQHIVIAKPKDLHTLDCLFTRLGINKTQNVPPACVPRGLNNHAGQLAAADNDQVLHATMGILLWCQASLRVRGQRYHRNHPTIN